MSLAPAPQAAEWTRIAAQAARAIPTQNIDTL
jgi:hypothetical protein